MTAGCDAVTLWVPSAHHAPVYLPQHFVGILSFCLYHRAEEGRVPVPYSWKETEAQKGVTAQVHSCTHKALSQLFAHLCHFHSPAQSRGSHGVRSAARIPEVPGCQTGRNGHCGHLSSVFNALKDMGTQHGCPRTAEAQ